MRIARLTKRANPSRSSTGKDSHSFLHTGLLAKVQNGLRSQGRPLEPNTLQFMQSRFGQSFAHVRVHTNEQADRSAQSINAKAYTVGRDIVFASGEYRPHTPHGIRTLAHELVHVLQQRNATAMQSDTPSISAPADRSEQEADRIADLVVSPVSNSHGWSKSRGGAGGLLHQPLAKNNPGYASKGGAHQQGLSRLVTQTRLPSIQRIATFANGSVSNTFNAAERTVLTLNEPNIPFGMTEATLNGGTVDDARDAIRLFRQPTFDFKKSAEGVSCSIKSIPENIASYKITALSKSPWSVLIARSKVIALAAIHAVKPCMKTGASPTATDITFAVKGDPSDEAFAKAVLEHEEHHANDYRKIFNDVVAPWDSILNGMRLLLRTFTGANEDECKKKIYQEAGGTPAEIATALAENLDEATIKFHDSPEGANSKIKGADADSTCSTLTATVGF